MTVLNTRAARFVVFNYSDEDYTIDAPRSSFSLSAETVAAPVIFASAELAAAIVSTITGNTVLGVRSSLNSQFNIDPIGNTVLGVQSSISSQFNIDTASRRIANADIELAGNLAISASSTATAAASSALTDHTVLDSTASARLAGSAQFTNPFTSAATGVATVNGIPQFNIAAQISATATSSSDIVVDLTGQFAQTTDGAVRVRYADTDLTITATESGLGQLILGGISTLAAQFDLDSTVIQRKSADGTLLNRTLLSAEIDNVRTARAELIASSGAEIAAQRIPNATANFTSTVTESTTGTLVQPAGAAINTRVTVQSIAGIVNRALCQLTGNSYTVIGAERISNTSAGAVVTANTTATGARIAHSTADFTVAAQITSDGLRLLDSGALLDLSTDQTAQAILIQTADSTLFSISELAVIPQRIVYVTAPLDTLFDSDISAFRGTISDYRTIIVQPETRTIQILLEDRTLIVLGSAA